ncbi:F0F1 ATP synthase subunit B family protein [Aliiglaciecola aliphaticivorans]
MPIDWFTLVAQTLNFLILLWLLKRFLYHPIIAGLNKRETKIAQILNDANSKNEKAKALQSEYQVKLSQIEDQRREIINKAHQEAKVKSQELLNMVQQQGAEILETRLHGIEQEIQALQHQIVQRSMQEVFATSQRVLHDLADTQLQTLMFNKLMGQLNSLNTEQHNEINRAVNSNTPQIYIHSSFELTSSQKDSLQQWFHRTYTKKVDAKDTLRELQFTYKITPELICGIEVVFDGWKVPWSTQSYLDSMQTNLLQQQPKLTSEHIIKATQVESSDTPQSSIG